MRGLPSHRFGHYLLLLAVGSALVFPYLGTPSLWDDDEGVNAECAREMAETGTWIVPLFNWELRTAKPVLLYWLLRHSYGLFGVNEFSARLPSALAFLGSILLTYELGRRMFGAATGLLAGVIAASTLELVKLGRAATPDSTLICFLMLYFWAFWRGHEDGRRSWYVPCGIASALAMLVKGPIGLALPVAIVGVYFLRHRELGRLFDRRMIAGILVWILVAIPWYALVTAETRGEWTRAFFLKENLGRSTEPMESHRGPWLYYLGVLCIFFAPWSSFLIVALRDAVRRMRHPVATGFQLVDTVDAQPTASGGSSSTSWKFVATGTHSRAVRLLLIWIAVVVVLFSLVATKLPHYIAPAYPALAILTAIYLMRWVKREIELPRWALVAAVAGFVLTGLIVGIGLGAIGEFFENVRTFDALAGWAWIGLVPILGAGAFVRFARRDQRQWAVTALAASTVAFAGLLVAYPPVIVDRAKAVKELVAESGARDLHRDARVASFDYSQPSITFYAARRVERLHSPEAAAAFLAMPHPSYLFVPAPMWDEWVTRFAKPPYRIAARRYDFYHNCDILVVVNDR